MILSIMRSDGIKIDDMIQNSFLEDSNQVEKAREIKQMIAKEK